MDQEQFDEIVSRLDAMLKLLALNLPSELSLAEKISRLNGTGLRVNQIARILGTSDGYVSVAIDREKKKARSGKPQPKVKPTPPSTKASEP